MIDTILFDLDDTLMPEDEPVEKAFLAACAVAQGQSGVPVAELAAAVRRIARQLWTSAPTHDYCRKIGISSWEGLSGDLSGDDPNLRALAAWAPSYRREVWTQSLRAFDIENGSLVAALEQALIRERRLRHRLFPEAWAVLTDLRADYRLGMLTNGASAIQREKIAATGIERFFDALVVTGEIGFGKPDPRAFEHALAALGSVAERTAMVGNSVRNDIAGAQRVGIRTIWVRRRLEEDEHDHTADETVSDLRQLRSALRALGTTE
ncbi:HAD family hydrolase [Candidatus Poribacteria bacterium]|nr:HAD family hydrolase [Candidatus Poribacteria bacterium]